MNKKICLLLLLIISLCSVLLISCSNEELDHVHNYVERIIGPNGESSPTCTTDARKEKICVVCEDVILIEVLTAKGHTPNDWQVKTEPSCTVGKVEERLCKDCGYAVETKVHLPLGHTPSEWQVVTDASCTVNLVEEQLCTKCGEVVDTKVGNKIQHEYTQTVMNSTCLVGEHIVNTCIYCGNSYGTDYAAPTEEHIWSESWIVETAPTCCSDGLKKKICTACSTAMTYESIPLDQNNHSFLVETVPSENENEGYVKYTCKNCGYEITNAYESNYLPSQIYEMIVSSTVRIEACDKDGKTHSIGSGFFISDKGEILTNYHVIAGAYKLNVKLYGGDAYEAITVKGYDIENDIAIIKIGIEGNSYLQLSSEATKTGDPVYALGSPLGVDDVFTDGIISNPSKIINGREMVVFSAPIAPGNSGGPLVNARGEVVGINTMLAENGQNLNFALPVSFVKELDTSVEKTVYETYTECLNVSGINALAYYIMLNSEKTIEENKYVIEKVVFSDSENQYVRTLRAIYDSEKKCVTLSVDWTDSGKNLYSVEFLLDSIGEAYKVRMYDHVWSQYTVEGTVSTKTQAVANNVSLDESVYSKILTFDYINYSETVSNNMSKGVAKQLVGIAYIGMLRGFDAILEGSNTELTLEHFNFQAPLTAEAE